MARRYEVGGHALEPALLRTARGLTVRLGEAQHSVTLRPQPDGSHLLEVDGVPRRAWIAADGGRVHVQLDGRTWSVEAPELADGAGAGAGGAGADTAAAPMPGTVLAVHVSPGDMVHRGQTLVTIESMKMETPIHAWRDGTVAEVHQPAGGTFDRGAPLVTLAAAEAGDSAGDAPPDGPAASGEG